MSPGERPAPGVERFPARLAGLLVTADRRTAAIVVRTADRPGGRADTDAWVAEPRRLVDRYRGAADLHLSGIGVETDDVVSVIRRDKAVLIPASVPVLAAMLRAAFRRASGVAILLPGKSGAPAAAGPPPVLPR